MSQIRPAAMAVSTAIFLLLYSLLTATCLGRQAPPLRIMTSVFPLKEFAQAVVGPRGEVSLLLPPGAEIHTWQPRPSDIFRLSSADLFITIGSGLEPWADDILRSIKNPDLRVLEASRGLLLLAEEHPDDEPREQDHEHSGVDPHIWLDLANDQIIVDKIVDALAGLDPENASLFEQNGTLYKAKLKSLDERFKQGLLNCRHSTLILGGHAAFGYLARRYGLEQVALYGFNPEAKPTPRQLIKVVRLAREKGIKAVFFERQLSHEMAEVIAKEVGARTFVLNSGANLSSYEVSSGLTFLEIMENNLENLRNGLSCR